MASKAVVNEEDDTTSITARGAVISLSTYYWLTDDHGEDEYAGFEHYVTFNWVLQDRGCKSNVGELKGMVYERVQGKLEIQEKPAEWAAKPERTCNWGKQRNKKKCEEEKEACGWDTVTWLDMQVEARG
ncbi:hypothetical protein PG997_011249 [Apiospora hydei]|uniref:Uncharacterized protein n=1 Tax=Apiospora hydei TaxID=1337664 RepID=A0ABR1VL71_9PEZI